MLKCYSNKVLILVWWKKGMDRESLEISSIQNILHSLPYEFDKILTWYQNGRQ